MEMECFLLSSMVQLDFFVWREDSIRQERFGKPLQIAFNNNRNTLAVEGLDNYSEAFSKPEAAREAVKVFYKVASF